MFKGRFAILVKRGIYLFLCIGLLVTLVSRPSFSQFSTAALKIFFTNERIRHEQWVINTLARDNIFPALMKMTEQINTGESKSSELGASFSDSRNHTMTETSANELIAETAEAARPDDGFCRQISTRKTLTTARETAKANQNIISSGASDLLEGRAGTIAGEGPDTLAEREVGAYQSIYCNPADMNGAVECNADAEMQNADIDPSTVFGKSTNPDLDFAVGDGGSNGVAQDYIKNLCNLKPAGEPPLYAADDPEYVEIRLRQERLQLAQKQCIDSVAGVMGFYAPGEEAMPDAMKATLLEAGFTEEDLEDNFYADGPSENELYKANIMATQTPAAMVDGVTSEENLRRQANQNRILSMQITAKGLSTEEQAVRNMAVLVGLDLNDRLEEIGGNLLQTPTQGGSR
ncbi:MAG: hypothetical protein CMH28_08800 [Micavibrio sp.]|nr:hypothetical protein [Micavibrio sp.]